jgi:Na+(H+)/acetate symporter ActP
MKNIRDLLGVIVGAVVVTMTLIVVVTSIVTGIEHATFIPFLVAAAFSGAGCIFGNLTLGKVKKMIKRHARRGKK